jgi:hypothetical protein
MGESAVEASHLVSLRRGSGPPDGPSRWNVDLRRRFPGHSVFHSTSRLVNGLAEILGERSAGCPAPRKNPADRPSSNQPPHRHRDR